MNDLFEITKIAGASVLVLFILKQIVIFIKFLYSLLIILINKIINRNKFKKRVNEITKLTASQKSLILFILRNGYSHPTYPDDDHKFLRAKQILNCQSGRYTVSYNYSEAIQYTFNQGIIK